MPRRTDAANGRERGMSVHATRPEERSGPLRTSPNGAGLPAPRAPWSASPVAPRPQRSVQDDFSLTISVDDGLPSRPKPMRIAAWNHRSTARTARR